MAGGAPAHPPLRWPAEAVWEAVVLLLHLGMTGTFRIEADAGQPRPHDRVIFYLDDGRRWVFEDPRRFGHIALCAIPRPGATPACLAGLAPEPFAAEFSVPWLAAACRGRRRPIKNVIMDNALVVGVGNIYASESLFRAGIHPATPAGRLTRPRLEELKAQGDRNGTPGLEIVDEIAIRALAPRVRGANHIFNLAGRNEFLDGAKLILRGLEHGQRPLVRQHRQ